MIGKRLINTGAAADAVFTPSEHFNTVLYTGNGSTQRIGGYINRGAVFNGSSSHIDIGDVIPNTDTDYSVSAWINIDSGFTSGNRTILGAASSSSGTEGSFRLQLTYVSANTYKITIARTVATSGTNFYYSSSWTASSINTGQWYHIVATYNSTGRVGKTYLNGAAVDSSALTSSASVSSVNNDLIGGQRTNTAKWLGKIDQFRIFNKVLSQQEVTTLSNETHASTTISTTDIFDDDSGVALYQLDGNANDTGGVSGKFGSAAIFNGTSSGITSSSLGTALNVSSLSFSLWFKTNLNDSTDRILISSFDGAGNARFYASLLNSGLSVVIYGSSSTYIQNFINTVTTETWYHLSVTHTGTTTTVYLNGTAITPSSTSGSAVAIRIAGSPQPLTMGQLQGNIGTYGLNGSIDQVRIFNTALTQANVNTLYAETASSTISISGLLAHYKLDGDARDEQQLYDGTATNVTYAYDGTASNVTYQEATNFSPDLVWIKDRDATNWHNLQDTIRGATKHVYSNAANAEDTTSDGLTSFDSNGFTVGGGGGFGNSGNRFVAWCFNAGDTTTTIAANTVGNTIASDVRANQDAGFSIVKYTGNGTAGATIGHGLTSLTPSLIIWKNLDATSNWLVYSPLIGSDSEWLYLNLTSTKQDSGNTNEYPTNKVNPTSSVVTVNGSGSSNNINISGQDTIMYCFADIAGYQKVGSYTGNGSASGPIVETGFEPAFLMIKNTSDTGDWAIFDNKRNTTNPRNNRLMANLNSAESTGSTTRVVDFLSNGFTIKSTNQDINANNDVYIYLAIAADPDTTTPTVENSFDVVTYTGNGGTQEIATDFKPDLVWIKGRDTSGKWNVLYDSIRGTTKMISSNQTDAEQTYGSVTMDSNSFTLGSGFGDGNTNNENYVAWCWKAGDHDDNLPQINTEGTIDSVVSVNDEAGFSIVKWTGNSTAGATIGTGLSLPPQLIIIKNLNVVGGSSKRWTVYAEPLGNTDYLYLNTTQQAQTYNFWNNTSPVSGKFTVSSDTNVNSSSGNYIAYCFTSVAGYQKIGSYTGTGTTSNSITTGFEPRFLMIKITSQADNWVIFDNARDTSNPRNTNLKPNSSAAETDEAGSQVNFTSTGFTCIGSGAGLGQVNSSGATYIYLAIK
jgi:hypothetical protein